MLDIPCVSFVRFPSGLVSSHDPVEIVRNLCTTAAKKDFQGPRSRYIQRLTPISLVRKTMASGLEALCDELLPAHFMVEEDPSAGSAVEDAGKPHPQGFKFAIRPTVRNNNKLNRDQVIQTVATKVEALGKGKHTVDLKGYDKLILVDVYRNIVGMSVVGSEFETLRRFNLSEIHSSHFGDDKT
jgi:tRNA acetyltransferase TAN1